jgi:predicted PurR-regulated permease PerM
MLLALIIGERLMGLSGIILAPVVLSFVKVEMKKIELRADGRPPVRPFQQPHREIAKV